jgi:Ca-activated chloride channel family protein
VVGFGLTREEGRQVACLAENTGGRYIEASNSGELSDALTQTVAAAPEPAPEPAPAPQAEVEFNFVPTTVLIAGSEPLQDGNVYEVYKARADGTEGEYVTTDYNRYRANLEPGRYFVRARMDHAETTQLVEIKAGVAAEPVFVLDAGTLIIRPRGSEGGEIVDAAAVNIRYQPDGDTTYYGATEAVFPKGELTVSVKIGEGQVVETIAMLPGETIERDIVVGVGRAVTNAYYVEGMKVDAGGLAINLFKAAKRIDGTREEVTYAYGPDAQFDLPAGEYVAVARLDEASAEAPFTVRVGERVEADIVLGAGVAFITAEGAGRIQIFSAARDVQGQRREFGYAYDAQMQTTLTAGEYVAVATRADDAKSEAALTVNAGERTEITVP